MCGIAVSYRIDGRPSEGWALPLMRHRGPDGEGTTAPTPGAPTLEHCRLAIIDPTNREADQPFSDPSGRWTMVYNGELFNYRELRDELEALGESFRTASDTEVVLRSLMRDGDAALSRFRGMFALVLWDAERRILLAARDQIGVKPLYYTLTDGVFIAASELRTVLAHPNVRPELDPVNVVRYLSFGFVPGAGTLVAGIQKLSPGHVLRVEGTTLTVNRYWDPYLSGLPAIEDEDAAVDELRRRLRSSVKASLVSDVPVSMMLSGGLDSSAIAALASQSGRPEELTAYSVSFGLPSDEAPAARRLAADLGIQHREILLDRAAVAEEFEEWLAHLDVPTANPTWVAVACIARNVALNGHKVLLSGDGPDELFAGYNRWMTYIRFHDRVWARTPRVARRVGGRLARPALHGLARDIARRAAEDGPLFVGSRPFHDDDLEAFLGPVGRSAAASSPPEDAILSLRGSFDERAVVDDELAWMSYLALQTDLVEDYLVRLDTMGMAHAVEGRVPLLDVDLVEFASRIPQRVKIGPRFEQKALFRRAVTPLLPAYITERSKQGFCPPVTVWASELIGERPIDDSALVDAGVLKPGVMEALAHRTSMKSAFAAWTVGTLASWASSL